MSEERFPSIYQDLVNSFDERYAKLNEDLFRAIKYNLGKENRLTCAETDLLYDVILHYESRREPVSISIGDFAELYHYSSQGIQKALGKLIDKELIRIHGKRQGRAKTKYVPNVEMLQSWLRDYVVKFK